MMLGAGRANKESKIDLAVGLMLRKKVGDTVKKGDSLVTIYSNQAEVTAVEAKIQENMTISEKAEPIQLIHEVIVD